MNNHLIIMVKEPRPGRVKTRLGRDIGLTTAAWWFRHQTKRLIQRLQDPRWSLTLAVAPDIEGYQSRIWPNHIPRLLQGQGDLGARMARAMRSVPPGPVCVIGADIPDVMPQHINDAFKALGANDAVFGPAPDGGYWLVGIKNSRQVPQTLFRNVRWSTQYALADTKASLPGSSIAEITTLRDVDTARDL